MPTSFPHEPLPAGMTLVETSDGRWYPAYDPFSPSPSRVYFVQVDTAIPPALEPLEPDEEGRGYCSREEAIAAFCAWREATQLPNHWRKLAAHTELYPERNVWYLQALSHLTGDETPRFSYSYEVVVIIVAEERDGRYTALSATGATPDEAIEALYARVYEWYGQQHAQQTVARAS